MPEKIPSRVPRDRDQTRLRILETAIRQFSEDGLAGARTERIAGAAGVNKALLYYYFQDKEALYAAALDEVAQRVVASGLAVLEEESSAGERLLRFALQHFDRMHSQRDFQSLMHHEMVRLHHGEKNALLKMVDTVFRPMIQRCREVLAEGCKSGELIDVDELQMIYAALGANVFCFMSRSVIEVMLGADPFEHDALEHRRKVTMEYLGQTIFVDRAHGAQAVAKVLASSPMPDSTGLDWHSRVHAAMRQNGRGRIQEGKQE